VGSRKRGEQKTLSQPSHCPTFDHTLKSVNPYCPALELSSLSLEGRDLKGERGERGELESSKA
jgi:hypothetical protein